MTVCTSPAQDQANQNSSMVGRGTSEIPPLSEELFQLMVAEGGMHHAVDGPTTMHTQAALNGLSGFKITERKRAHEVVREKCRGDGEKSEGVGI